MTSSFAFDEFFQSSVNPNMRGLGHSGCEDGNPTHCIRFQFNIATKTTEMVYKLHEADDSWRPTNAYDETSGTWVPQPEKHLFYELISKSNTTKLLESEPSISRDPVLTNTLKATIMKNARKIEGYPRKCGGII